jgi:hypothetical protein
MKRMLLTLTFIAMLSAVVLARDSETIALKVGQQKSAGKGAVVVKFLSVEEDSRCPVGVQCVWAGNAKIKVKIGYAGGDSKVVEMNTASGPKGDQLSGWAINLTNLTPLPSKNGKTRAPRYTATFTISRLSR